jgi:hypothetical protein
MNVKALIDILGEMPPDHKIYREFEIIEHEAPNAVIITIKSQENYDSF